MSINYIIFLLITIITLGEVPTSRGDLYSAAFDDHEYNNDKGQQHTIHSLRGHYKEEAQRHMKCGGIDKKEQEIHFTVKSPEREVEVAPAESQKALEISNADEKPKSDENPTITEYSSNKEDPTTTDDPNDSEKSSNETQETIETAIVTENLENLILPISENLQEFQNNDNNSQITNTTDMTEAELNLRALSEMLKESQDNSVPSRRVNNEERPIIKTTNEHDNSSHSLEEDHDSVIDRTQKNFEFESLVIKNDADKPIDKYDEMKDDINNTRRLMPPNSNPGQFPMNYNPIAKPPPRGYAAPINPNLLNVQGNNSNNLHQSNPIASNQIEESLKNNNNSINLPESKDSKNSEPVDESDTNLLFNDSNITDEDLSRVAIYPTKGFGISEMDKSNFIMTKHPRVCFACSSTNNPSCWIPDMRTPAKYCRRDHNACIAKIYKHKGYAFMVRDCGNSCLKQGEGLQYQSCTICHSDLCNSADSTSLSLINI